MNDKQRLFCIYYIRYFNATKVYRKAYECDYKTANVTNVNGSRLQVNANIRDEITKMKEERGNWFIVKC
ncbi:terminase small subunit [Sporosarcina sp. OR05]|uniref:terminase small subunit n=1 Tax=Sporosarcina sp. OR05 TaxID=2969819 RepID=UPI00352AE859